MSRSSDDSIVIRTTAVVVIEVIPGLIVFLITQLSLFVRIVTIIAFAAITRIIIIIMSTATLGSTRSQRLAPDRLDHVQRRVVVIAHHVELPS